METGRIPRESRFYTCDEMHLIESCLHLNNLRLAYSGVVFKADTVQKNSCTISTCIFGDFVALIALIAWTRLQGNQSDWKRIQGVSKCL